MNVLIIGSTGMLGNTLKKYLTKINIDFKTLDRNDIDLSKCGFIEIEESIVKSNCDVVINCAGIVKQRKKTPTADFIHVNSLIPHWVADICEKKGIKMIHITTDCVFDGQLGDYKENDIHNTYDDYGRSKSMGEPNNCTVIRTSIIGEEEKNKLSLLEWVKSNKNGNINGYKNHIWNGVTCLQLSKIMMDIANNMSYWEGVKHIFSNKVSKYDLSKMINEIYDLNIKITPIDDVYSVNRTIDTIYDVDVFNIPNLYKQIKETKDFHNDIKNEELKKYYDNLL